MLKFARAVRVHPASRMALGRAQLQRGAVRCAAAILVAAVHVQAASAKAEDRSDKVRGAVIGALVADALCLGTHYEYDAVKIKQHLGGTIDRFMAPGEKMGGETHGVGWGKRNYHPGKTAGENTDYGDGNLFLLEYLAEHFPSGRTVPFSAQHYVEQHWLAQYNGWQTGKCRGCRAWVDTMTRTVLSNIARGLSVNQAGGMSNGQVVRFAGALAVYDSEAELVNAARASTEFTNRNPQPIAASEFWARTAWRVIRGEDPVAAMEAASVATGDRFISDKVKQALDKVREATDPASQLSKEEFVDDLALTSMARLWEVGKSEPIKVGKASPTEGTLPGAVYFIAKYKDFKAAAQANAMVGGDNASRSIPIGIVLGAAQGLGGIPAEWRAGLKEGEHALALLDKLPHGKAAGGKAEL